MAGSRSSIDVFLALHGQRKFAREVAASGAELEAMGVKGARSMARFAKSADKLKRFGKTWTHNVTLPVVGLGVAAGYMAANFKRSVLMLHTQAGVATEDLGGLEEAFLRISRLTTFSPTEISEAAYRLAGAGLRGKKLEEATLKSAQLAMVGGANPEDTAKTLSQIWFTNIKGGKDFNRVIGEINATVGAGDLRLPNLVEALGTGVVAAGKQAGLSLQDVTGALAVFGDETNNVSGWSAQLATALHYLYAPTNKAEGALESLGLSGSQLGKAMHGPHGLATALGLLKGKLEELPGGADGTQAAQALSKILPGGKGRVLLVLLNQLERLEEKEKQIKGTTDEFGKSLRETEQQPKVKLEKAWSSLQASLVELGSELLPAAVPALETIASDTEKVAHAFMSLPGPVKAATLGLLVLTGPVASGLGYFASGVGRALVLTAKLGRVAQNVGIFTQALRAGQGVKGAAGIGFSGFGQSAAVQTAKGMAYALGPAVAAAGLGKIVLDATQGDWTQAGGEAGFALAGGILGSFAGPIGTMFGVGIGSFVGDAFGKLFDSGSKLPALQSKIAQSSKGIKSALEAEHSATENLVTAGKGLVEARHKQKSAVRHLHTAEHNLEVTRANAPAGSKKIVEAEVEVAEAVERVTGAKRRARRAERLHGEKRVIAKEGLRYAALEERHRKRLIKQKLGQLRDTRRSMKEHGAGLGELKPVNDAIIENLGKLRTVNKQTNETYETAAKQVGPKFAHFLRHASREALKLGSNMKAVLRKGDELLEWSNQFRSYEGPNLLTPVSPLAPIRPLHKRHQGGRPNRHAAQRHNRAAARRLSLAGTGLSGVVQVNVQNENTLHLDGKKVAESTTTQSKRAALLE